MIEEWKPIGGLEHYEVSNLGRVRSWKNARWGRRDTPKFIKPWIDTGGYPCVAFWDKGVKVKQSAVHLLVLEAFVGPRPAGLEGAHLDGNPDNCEISNLKWVTRSENGDHKNIHGTARRGLDNPNGKLTDDQVEVIRNTPKTYGSGVRLAKEYDVSPQTISDIRSGRERRESSTEASARASRIYESAIIR